MAENELYIKNGLATSIKSNSTNKTIVLKEGDLVYVGVTNQNSTAAQTLKSSLLNFSSADEKVISANCSGMVNVNGTN